MGTPSATAPSLASPTPAPAGSPCAAAPSTVALFDGSCPLCTKEIALLRTMKNAGSVVFTDVSLPTFVPPPGCPPRAALMKEMHVLQGGVVHARVPAFRALYTALGWGRFFAWTARPPYDALLDRAYTAFLHLRPRLQRLLR